MTRLADHSNVPSKWSDDNERNHTENAASKPLMSVMGIAKCFRLWFEPIKRLSMTGDKIGMKISSVSLLCLEQINADKWIKIRANKCNLYMSEWWTVHWDRGRAVELPRDDSDHQQNTTCVTSREIFQCQMLEYFQVNNHGPAMSLSRPKNNCNQADKYLWRKNMIWCCARGHILRACDKCFKWVRTLMRFFRAVTRVPH